VKKLVLALLGISVVTVAFFAIRSGAPEVGDAIRDFTLNTLDGAALNTAAAREGKVLVLKFGATWCTPCNKQIPELNEARAAYPDDVVILDVDVREEASRVKAHNRKRDVTYTTVLDPDGSVAKRYGVRSIPVVIIADKDGRIVYRGNYTRFAALKKAIDDLLRERRDG